MGLAVLSPVPTETGELDWTGTSPHGGLLGLKLPPDLQEVGLNWDYRTIGNTGFQPHAAPRGGTHQAGAQEEVAAGQRLQHRGGGGGKEEQAVEERAGGLVVVVVVVRRRRPRTHGLPSNTLGAYGGTE